MTTTPSPTNSIILNLILPSPPLPTKSVSFIDAIPSSCHACLPSHNIFLNQSACDRFLLGLDRNHYHSRLAAEPPRNIRFPLQFDCQLDELNLTCMVCLLDGLHVHDQLLNDRTGRGAWETIRYLILASYLDSNSQASLLTTHGMLGVTPAQLSSALALPLHVERPIGPNSPITLAEPDPAVGRLIEDLISLLRSTGQVLQKSGLPNLGTFVAARTSLNDDEMVRQLAGAFPAFQDMYILEPDHHVYIMKRALTLVDTLRHGPIRFPNLTSPRPILADHLLPVMLLRMGLIDASQSTEPSLREIDPSSQATVALASRPATILRAAGVACCDLLIDRCRTLAETHKSLEGVNRDGLLGYLSSICRDQSDAASGIKEQGAFLY